MFRPAEKAAQMADWLAPTPAMKEELRPDGRRVRCFVDRPRSVWALLALAVATRPEGDAVVCGAERLGWRDLQRQAEALAVGLTLQGVGRGDRVALLLGNRVEFVVAI